MIENERWSAKINGEATVHHPTERRRFSIQELKRICAFPADFQMLGSYAQQWKCLGNSVPPLMMKSIATIVRDAILKKIK
jgi:DNA (cytosine-5)-methyltransferase 1